MIPSPSGTSIESFIQLQGIGFRYSKNADYALNDVSLSIPHRSCFGLLGPNGAGKTTLISILTGMLPLQQGQVLLNGVAVNQWSELKQIGAVVPQDFAFYPTLSGRENLSFFAGLFGLSGKSAQQRVEEIAALCRVDTVLDKPASTYSGGLKRRLNLAIGLLNKPDILYLDEPTVGIDAQSRHFILEAIAELKRQGMTIIYTSHYMEEVQAICDRIAIIDHGQLVIENSVSELLSQADHQALRVSILTTPNEDQLKLLSSLGDVKQNDLQLHIELHSADITFEKVMETFGKANLSVRQIQYGLNKLEDIYLQYTTPDLRD